jgi:hypothetical protein
VVDAEEADDMNLPPHICAQCEDKSNLVTEANGFSFDYNILKDARVEIFLHDDCANAWYEDFAGDSPEIEKPESYRLR